MSNWVFDQHIASVFTEHARKHIPHYDHVVQKSVNVCQKLASPSDPILDVGCATGNTLTALHAAGFNNLYGIDSSVSMLDVCPRIANLVCADTLAFAPNSFQVILCNWTLHFIKNKSEYLANMARLLAPGGVLVITDKVSLDPLMIDFYHDFKHNQGVTESEILAKEQSLRNVMFINSPDWYQKQFTDLGLTYYVIDADYAFMTFLCIKR